MKVHVLIGTCALALGVLACAGSDAELEDATNAVDDAVEAVNDAVLDPADLEVERDGETVSLVGCLLREDDYRSLVGEDGGGVLSTGVGIGDEYVLMNAIEAPGEEEAAPTGPADMAAAYAEVVGDSAGHAYMLEGGLEEDLAGGVDRLVEVVGTLGPLPDSGPGDNRVAANTLQRLSLTTWHVAADYCPE